MIDRPVDLHAQYDIIVIGAGIYGAALAWEATSRGMSVLLLDKADFGSVTSSNSLKTIHGGIRYLQKLNLKRVLESKRERDTYMRIAPHLVQALSCVMPSYAWTAKGKLATIIGAALYNGLSAWDEPEGHPVNRRLRAALLPRSTICKTLPDNRAARVNGGIRWFDGQAFDSERLVLAFVLSVGQRGGHVFNYMQAKALHVTDNSIQGLLLEDQLSGKQYAAKGQYIIDASGSMLGREHEALRGPATASPVLAKAVNLVYPCAGMSSALGMKVEVNGSSDRLLFAAPWRDRTLVGTWYFPVTDASAPLRLTSAEYQICTTDVRRWGVLPTDYDGAPSLIHAGLVPVMEDFKLGEYPRLAEETLVTRHGDVGGPANLISVCGTKYTTARATAQQVIDPIAKSLGDDSVSCSSELPLYGGGIADYDAFMRVKIEQYGALLDQETLLILLRLYGSSIDRLMAYAARDKSLLESIPGEPNCIKAQIIFAVREELVQRLCDLVVRRLGIGGRGRPDTSAIAYCAASMASLAAWSEQQMRLQVRELEEYYEVRSR